MFIVQQNRASSFPLRAVPREIRWSIDKKILIVFIILGLIFGVILATNPGVFDFWTPRTHISSPVK